MNILISLQQNLTMNSETNEMCVFFLVQGSRLDSNKKGSSITLANNGRTASVFNDQGSVVGTVGYRSGVYQWRFKFTKLESPRFGYVAIGVTTLPLDRRGSHRSHHYDDYRYRSDGTMYAWFSNQDNRGLAASQTRGPARISWWKTGDLLLLTLNCDQLQLHLHLQRTAERKTINMKTSVRGEKLYLYVYMNSFAVSNSSSSQQVDIVS